MISVAEHAAEHLRGAGQRFVQIDGPGKHRLPAAEGEQLPREIGGALRGRGDAFDILRGRGRQVLLPEEQLGVALDDGEDVVEIVRDARGEQADGLHLLRLQHLLFEAAAAG